VGGFFPLGVGRSPVTTQAALRYSETRLHGFNQIK
jgi:hypothetical protein